MVLDLLLTHLSEAAVPTYRLNSNAITRDFMGNPQGSHTFPTIALNAGSLWLMLLITRLLMFIITRLLFLTAALLTPSLPTMASWISALTLWICLRNTL